MGSPWGRYKEVLDLENLNDSVTVAEREAPHYRLVAIKRFPSIVAEKALERHQRVKHENIIDLLNAFTTDRSLYIVLEHLPISPLQMAEGVNIPLSSEGRSLNPFFKLESHFFSKNSLIL